MPFNCQSIFACQVKQAGKFCCIMKHVHWQIFTNKVITENDWDNSVSLELEDLSTLSLISIPTMRVSGNIGDKSTAKQKDTCNYLFKSPKRSLVFYLLPFQQLHSFPTRPRSQGEVYI